MKLRCFSLFTVLIFELISPIKAKNQELFASQKFRFGERIIRIAEPRKLTDYVNVWGDAASTCRYVVPKETTLLKLLS